MMAFADGARSATSTVVEWINVAALSSLQSPHGVYQVVAAMAQERFKRSHQIKYTFETVNGERNPAIRIVPR